MNGATPNIDKFSLDVQAVILRSYERSLQQTADLNRIVTATVVQTFTKEGKSNAFECVAVRVPDATPAYDPWREVSRSWIAERKRIPTRSRDGV